MKKTFLIRGLTCLSFFCLSVLLTNFMNRPTVYSYEKTSEPSHSKTIKQLEWHANENSDLMQILLYNVETPSWEFSQKYHNNVTNMIVMYLDLYNKKGDPVFRYKYLLKSVDGRMHLEIQKIGVESSRGGKVNERRLLAILYDANMNGIVDGNSAIYEWTGDLSKSHLLSESGGVEFQEEFDEAIARLPNPAL